MLKKNIVKLVIVAFMAPVGGLLGYALGKWLPKGLGMLQFELSGIHLAALLLLIVPAYFFAIAWHEAGHALAGISVGFDFRMYVVGPFMWAKEGGRMRFKWNKRVNVSGGLALCVPKGQENLPRRFAVFVAGGPLASLIYTLIGAGAISALGVAAFSTKGFAGPALLAFAAYTVFFSLIGFIMTGLPFHAGGFYSDGARILRLLRGGDTARFDVILLRLIADTASGLRPGAYDTAALDEAQAIARRQNEPFGVYLQGYQYHAALDRGDLDAAERYLNNYVDEAEQIPPGIRSAVWQEAAFFYAHIRRDAERADFFWAKYTPSPILPKAQTLAAEAAIAFLKGDAETGAAKKAAAQRALPDMMDKGLADVLADRLNQMP